MEQFWLDFIQNLAILILAVSNVIEAFSNNKKEKKKK